jgi:hypothetical protein
MKSKESLRTNIMLEFTNCIMYVPFNAEIHDSLITVKRQG